MALLAVAPVFVPSPAASAEGAYPERPVRLVVGFPTGGTSDTVARILSPKLADLLGKPFVVDNRGGAAGNIATELVCNSAPDGYTTLLVQGTSLTVNPSVYKVSFSVERDLRPIIMIAAAQYMLVTHPSLNVHSVRQLIEYAKAHPGTLNYGSAGIGGPHQLSAELFKARTGVTMTHVAYKGGGPASVAVVSNEVQVLFGSLPSLLQHVRAKRLNGLAVTGATRAAVAPDIPTIAESGLPGYEVTSWFGLLVPRSTPDAIAGTLGEAVTHAMHTPEVREAIQRAGLEVSIKGPDPFGALIRKETAMWAQVVRSAHIRID